MGFGHLSSEARVTSLLSSIIVPESVSEWVSQSVSQFAFTRAALAFSLGHQIYFQTPFPSHTLWLWYVCFGSQLLLPPLQPMSKYEHFGWPLPSPQTEGLFIQLNFLQIIWKSEEKCGKCAEIRHLIMTIWMEIKFYPILMEIKFL